MTYNRPEDRVSPEEIGGVTPGMLTRLYAIKDEVETATRATGLPGWINGPADATKLPVDTKRNVHTRSSPHA
jgi:hypothetical protein